MLMLSVFDSENAATRFQSTMSDSYRSSSTRGWSQSCGACSEIQTMIQLTAADARTWRRPQPTPIGTQTSSLFASLLFQFRGRTYLTMMLQQKGSSEFTICLSIARPKFLFSKAFFALFIRVSG